MTDMFFVVKDSAELALQRLIIKVKLLNMENVDILKTQERSITLPEVAELEKPIKNIIEKIKERIERGAYGLVIGDDASGRIPTLILGGFIKRISKLRKTRESNIIFIPGKLNEKEDVLVAKEQKRKLQEHISIYGVKKGDRILIVTEAITTGSSLKALFGLLKELGFYVDVATMGIERPNSPFYEEDRKENLQDNIISGDYTRKGIKSSSYTPLIYGGDGREISGVYKNIGELKSKPISIVSSRNYVTESRKVRIQEKINKSRAEVGILVDKLVDWYLSQNQT